MKKLLSIVLVFVVSVGFLSSTSCFAINSQSSSITLNQPVSNCTSEEKNPIFNLIDWNTFKSLIKKSSSIGAKVGSVVGALAGLGSVVIQHYTNPSNLAFSSSLAAVATSTVIEAVALGTVAPFLTCIYVLPCEFLYSLLNLHI